MVTNTNGFYNMGPTQNLFWTVAVPITVVVLMDGCLNLRVTPQEVILGSHVFSSVGNRTARHLNQERR